VKLCPVCSTEYPDDVRFCPNDGHTLRSSSPGHDLVGQVIADRYHVTRKLGEGGMGQVYLAEHVKMGRKSAIKVMNPATVQDTDAVARFNREAANASRISHPNICAIYDFGETPEGLIYLAMEFVEGEPLTDVLEREGPLPVPRATAIFLQVADALQAAHDLGIVHRDLKPDNIMLARGRDGADVVKVVDFGIAKAVGGDDSQKVTKTGLVVGTPEFMSPEQLAGDKLDGRSDLYALALVLFKMLTGKLPFAGETVQDTMVKRLLNDPAPLAAVSPDLVFPPGLQATLDAALTRSPAERYRSIAKFASDVAAVVGVERTPRLSPFPPTRPGADAPTEPLGRSASRWSPRPPLAQRRRLLSVVAGAVIVLGGAGTALALRGGAKLAAGRATRADSARLGTGAAPVDKGALPAGSRTDRGGSDRPAARPATKAKPRQAVGSRIDVTRARELLDTLYLNQLQPKNAHLVRGSAADLFNAPGISLRDKAYAAFVIGMTFLYQPDRNKEKGCEWLRRAAHLDSDPYAQLAEQAGCPP
jgi:serine/threonine-protein kinase